MQVGRLWRTLRHLKWQQVSGRVRHRLRAQTVDASAFHGSIRAVGSGAWMHCARLPSMPSAGMLTALNETHALATPQDWNDPARSYLWQYNAHYFNDLAADDACARGAWHVELVRRWIVENPPGEGCGWEAYPLSLRIVNWVKWAWSGVSLPGGFDASLALQARALAARMEWHLLGNHLWANAKGLVFAGVRFEGDEASRWLRQGQDILLRELDEQWLEDGGHFERTPMYHAILLEDMLDLLQAGIRYPGILDARLLQRLNERVPPALAWLRAMTHPDGEPAFFNDTAMGIAPTFEQLQDYATLLGLGAGDSGSVEGQSQFLRDSGYARMAMGPAVLIADVGAIGPDYLPGHAHADTLSCEVSLHGRRLLVNGGISHYAADAERLRQRGTAAHNAVTLEGRDSSEVWSSFRVGRRARVRDVSFALDDGSALLKAAHDGYRWMSGEPLVRRTWQMQQDVLQVSDEVAPGHAAEAHWHLHLDWRIARAEDGSFTLSHAKGMAARLTFQAEGLHVRTHEERWHPEFGRAMAAQGLVASWSSGALVTRLEWI